MADELTTHIILARHYIWEALLQRAGPIPQALLAQIAMATAAEVPALGDDPVARVEWHMGRIIEVAKQVLAGQVPPPPPPPPSTASLVRALSGAEIGGLTYPAGGKSITHVMSDGAVCDTALPAICCACGRYLLIGESPSP